MLRFLRYLTESYQSLVTEGQTAPLPVVFPLLLYTGDATWSATGSTCELVQAEIPEASIPHLTCYPMMRNEVPTEILRFIHNAVSAVFYVANSDPRNRSQTLEEPMAILSDEALEHFDVLGRSMGSYLPATAGESTVTEPVRSAR